MILRHHQILKLPGINRYDLRDFQAKLRSQARGDLMKGRDNQTWGSWKDKRGYASDLLSLRDRPYLEPLTRFLSEKVIPFVYSRLRREVKPGDTELLIDDAPTLLWTRTFSTALVSQLLFAAIVVLFAVQSMWKKLAVIGLSNLLFTLLIPFFAQPQQTELFLLSAGFFAVQVVFVSGPSA